MSRMGIKDFMLKQVLKRKLAGLPEAQREAVLGAMDKNPELFKEIGEEIEKRKKSGQSEMQAAMAVMRERQKELQDLLRQ